MSVFSIFCLFSVYNSLCHQFLVLDALIWWICLLLPYPLWSLCLPLNETETNFPWGFLLFFSCWHTKQHCLSCLAIPWSWGDFRPPLFPLRAERNSDSIKIVFATTGNKLLTGLPPIHFGSSLLKWLLFCLVVSSKCYSKGSVLFVLFLVHSEAFVKDTLLGVSSSCLMRGVEHCSLRVAGPVMPLWCDCSLPCSPWFIKQN